MDREPENDERIEEVDWESRTKAGDRAGQGKGTNAGDTGDAGKTSRPSATQGDELQQMGNKKPDTGTSKKS